MAPLVHVEDKAGDRLAELGLTVEIVERVVRRADAEASMCTALDPPIMECLTRWGRTNRFLREELVAAGPGESQVSAMSTCLVAVRLPRAVPR